MKTLVVERDGRITVHEVNKPRYNEYQALVKTIACGMCGTDIKLIHRTFKGFPESVYPIMLGHEGVGDGVGVLPGNGVKQHQLQHLVVCEALQPSGEEPFPHPLPVPGMLSSHTAPSSARLWHSIA